MTLSGQQVSVVIPVLNAQRWLPGLLAGLLEQRPHPPAEILLLDSQSTDQTVEIARRQAGVRVIPVASFSHGGTRNLGAREARHEVLVLMTQDARPADPHWLAALLEPLADPQVAATYSRQVPQPDASPMEQHFLATHFPAEPAVRQAGDAGAELGLEQVFFSNVSAAIRRDLLLRHPFDETLIMSEDQQVSRDLIQAGHRIVYAPKSVVVHSHTYTLAACFRRYFDSAYSLTCIFRQHGMGASASLGLRQLVGEAAFVVRHHPLWIPYYLFFVAAKTAGTVLGHFADQLPRSWTRACSMHAYHWK